VSEVQQPSGDKQRKGISDEARRVERETATSALAQRMAADAWGWIFYLIGVPTAILAAVAGAAALVDHKNVAAGLALGAAVTSALTTFMKPGEQAKEHRRASTDYRAVENKAREFWKVQCVGQASTQELQHRLESLISEWNDADTQAPHVVSRLYRKAKESVTDDPKYR